MLNWGYLQLHSKKSKRQKIDYLAEILLDHANKYTQEEMRVLSALRSIVSREKVTRTIEFLEKWIIDDQFANGKIKADCQLLLVIAYIRAVKEAILKGRSNQTQYLTAIEKHLKMGEEFDSSSAWLQFEYGNYYCLCAKVSGDASNYHLALEKYRLSHSMDPSTPYSFNAMGDVFLKIQGDVDWLDAILKAKDYYCRALAICDGFAPSLNGLGNVYRETNHFKMAITYYKLAIEADPEFLYPWNYMGDCYRVLEQFPEAVECYKRAIEVNQGIVFPWYGIGKVLFDVGKITRDNELFEKSKRYFKKAHQINPQFGFAYLDYGRVLENQERYQEAKSKYKKAASMFTERQGYWKLEAERYISDLNKAAEQLSELKQKQDPVSIMLYQTIKNRVEENSDCNKTMFSASFLRPTLEKDWEDEANSEIFLETLRRWNSFTPFVTDSKGGGYFLKVKGEGIVIDPGHSFLDNFRAKGHHFYEIDKILFTHSHSDHTGDFEAMLNLLHEYNECLEEEYVPLFLGKKFNIARRSVLAAGSRYKDTAETLAGEKRQRIDVYMPDRVKVKFKGIIDNEPQCNLMQDPTCRVKTISAVSEVELRSTQEETPINDPYIELRRGGYIIPIKAKHKELTIDGPELMGTLGFLVQLDDTVIVFTGDTTWNEELRDQYAAIKQCCDGKYIISVAHLGGFKTAERDRKQYKNHLGRIGIVELITTLKPDLCLISEFGEEFKGLRVQLVAAINNALRRVEGYRSIILPTDDNFKISIRADKQIGIKVISGINPDARSIRYTEVNPEAVRVGEVNGELYYYSVNNKIKECYYQDALLGHYTGQGLEISGLPL